MSDKKRPPRDWEDVVEKQIREAIDRGDFDNLPGQGRPIDLGENPFTPPDWRLAYKILKDAGVSPEWIEEDKEIRRELAALAEFLEKSARSLRAQTARAERMLPDQLIAEHQRLADERERVCTLYRERANLLNRLIDLFNLKVPTARLQHTHVRVEQELSQFLKQSK